MLPLLLSTTAVPAYGKHKKGKQNLLVLSLYFFTYLSIMNLFSISTAVILHEFGHFSVGVANGCTGRIVIFEIGGEGPYTELQCPEATLEDMVSMGGFVLIIPFSLLFMIFRHHPIRNFSLVIIGLGLLLSGLDLLAIYESMMLLYVSAMVGGLLVVAGEGLLVNEYMSQIEKRRRLVF